MGSKRPARADRSSTGRSNTARIVPLFRPYRAPGGRRHRPHRGDLDDRHHQPAADPGGVQQGPVRPRGPQPHLLYILVGIMAAVPIVNGAIGILQTYETTRVGQLVMRDLRDRLYAHLQTLPLAFFTEHQDRRDPVPAGQRRGRRPDRGHHHRLDHPGQRRHFRLQHRRHGHHQLAADHRGGHHRAGVLLADQGGRRAAPPGVALDPGVAGGDERRQRGDAVGIRGAAGQGVRQPGARHRPLPAGEPAPGRPRGPPADDRPGLLRRGAVVPVDHPGC